MLLIITNKEKNISFSTILENLNVKYLILNTQIFINLKKCLYKLEKNVMITNVLFDMDYLLEQNDFELFTMIDFLNGLNFKIKYSFFGMEEEKYLIENEVELLNKTGFKNIDFFQNETMLLKGINLYIISNNLNDGIKSFSDTQILGEMRKKIINENRCVTIGIIGTINRIGTTTQSLQIMMFLKSLGYKVGLIQNVREENQDIKTYMKYIEENQYITSTEFSIYDLHFYGIENEKEALNDNDFLIYDFGVYSTKQMESFLLTDKKVVVTGCKNNEDFYFSTVLLYDTMHINKYIYSFVGAEKKAFSLKKALENVNKANIILEKNELIKRLFFSSYIPDLFTYCENDIFYSEILNIDLSFSKKRKKKGGFLGLRFPAISRIASFMK